MKTYLEVNENELLLFLLDMARIGVCGIEMESTYLVPSRFARQIQECLVKFGVGIKDLSRSIKQAQIEFGRFSLLKEVSR